MNDDHTPLIILPAICIVIGSLLFFMYEFEYSPRAEIAKSVASVCPNFSWSHDSANNFMAWLKANGGTQPSIDAYKKKCAEYKRWIKESNVERLNMAQDSK